MFCFNQHRKLFLIFSIPRPPLKPSNKKILSSKRKENRYIHVLQWRSSNVLRYKFSEIDKFRRINVLIWKHSTTNKKAPGSEMVDNYYTYEMENRQTKGAKPISFTPPLILLLSLSNSQIFLSKDLLRLYDYSVRIQNVFNRDLYLRLDCYSLLNSLLQLKCFCPLYIYSKFK